MVGGKGGKRGGCQESMWSWTHHFIKSFHSANPTIGRWFPMTQESITHKEMGCTVTRLMCIEVLGCRFLHQQDWWNRDACSGNPFWTEL